MRVAQRAAEQVLTLRFALLVQNKVTILTQKALRC
jgi:hypothetical protein